MKDIGSAQFSAFLDELASLVRGPSLTLGEHLTDHRIRPFCRVFSFLLVQLYGAREHTPYSIEARLFSQYLALLDWP